VNEAEDSLHTALLTELTRLGESNSIFTIIEFGLSGVAVWTVRRDANGTPQARKLRPVSVPPYADPESFYQEKLSPLIDLYAPLLIVRDAGADDPARLLDVICSATGTRRVYDSTLWVEKELREAVRNTPLTRWYELVVLKKTASGRLGLDAHPLFPPGAEYGYPQQISFRCEPSDNHGTVFAVITRDGQFLRPVTIQSALVPPGEYEVTAVLTRPGNVRFEGLPTELQPDPRPWPEIVVTVPRRLTPMPSVHLICLLEMAGDDAQVRRRIDRLDQLIKTVSAGQPLATSLISYGPHAFDRLQHEETVRIRLWAGTEQEASAALAALAARAKPADEYSRAARLECALAEVVSRLTTRDGRPVIVTAGGRPPFPPRSDLQTEIIPCPARQDWRWHLKQLRSGPDISFGALYDGETPAGEPWLTLGREVLESPSVADMSGFAARVGLRDPQQCVPFPLIN
jgi:hypothetical protein